MTSTQKGVFLASEGDSWYQRNATALSAACELRELAAATIAVHAPKEPMLKVLEIGCGRGDNLATLAEHRAVEGFGIEPSLQAVREGRQAFPKLHLQQGTADELPFADGEMDVVWFGFCLYLVDRSLLMRAVAEADRVLRDGGLLAIVDFDPGIPTMRRYHHREGLNSYKLDYSRLFLANPAYTMVEKRSATHAGAGWVADPQERLAIWLCMKNMASAYQQG